MIPQVTLIDYFTSKVTKEISCGVLRGVRKTYVDSGQQWVATVVLKAISVT